MQNLADKQKLAREAALEILKPGTVLKPEQLTEELLDVACFADVCFGVRPTRLVSMEINNPLDVGEDTDETVAIRLTGWPTAYVKDGQIVLESCWGWAKEDRLVCSEIYVESIRGER